MDMKRIHFLIPELVGSLTLRESSRDGGEWNQDLIIPISCESFTQRLSINFTSISHQRSLACNKATQYPNSRVLSSPVYAHINSLMQDRSYPKISRQKPTAKPIDYLLASTAYLSVYVHSGGNIRVYFEIRDDLIGIYPLTPSFLV